MSHDHPQSKRGRGRTIPLAAPPRFELHFHPALAVQRAREIAYGAGLILHVDYRRDHSLRVVGVEP